MSNEIRSEVNRVLNNVKNEGFEIFGYRFGAHPQREDAIQLLTELQDIEDTELLEHLYNRYQTYKESRFISVQAALGLGLATHFSIYTKAMTYFNMLHGSRNPTIPGTAMAAAFSGVGREPLYDPIISAYNGGDTTASL